METVSKENNGFRVRHKSDGNGLGWYFKEMENDEESPLLKTSLTLPSLISSKDGNQIFEVCKSKVNGQNLLHEFFKKDSHLKKAKLESSGSYDSNQNNEFHSKLVSSLASKKKNKESFKIDFSSCEGEKSNEGYLQSINVSDLSFLSNNFSLEDCNHSEQTSQLVDEDLKNSGSTSFSFNSDSDLFHLLKSGLNSSNKDCAITNSSNQRNISSLSSNNKFSLNNEKLIQECNIRENITSHHEIHEVTQSNLNTTETNQSRSNDSKEKNLVKRKKDKIEWKRFGKCPIKKGRRYLPNFKFKVLQYARKHTYKETALHFHINSNTITEWTREIKEKSPLKVKGTKTDDESFTNKHCKTDILDKPKTKTEIIFFNQGTSLETDHNDSSLKSNMINFKMPLSSPPPFQSPSSSSSMDMKPEEMFLKWVKKKRSEKRELTREEVFQIAKCCLRKRSENVEISPWFVSWLERYNKVLNSANSNVQMEKYIKYPNNFKLEVVMYARSFTKNSAARVFNVSRKRAFDWCSRFFIPDDKACDSVENDESRGEGKNKYQINFAVKKDERKDKIYSELHVWYQKMFFGGNRPTSKEIKEKAREIFSSYGLKEIKFSDGWLQKFCRKNNIKLRHSEDDELLMWILTQFDNNVSLSHQEITEKSSSLIGRKRFKGSKGWTLRFLKRHKNLLQRSPTFADQLPSTAQKKLALFWDNFRQNLISHKVESNNIGCMDEIPINFSYPQENSTYKPLLRKTGFDNCQGIIILSSKSNGQLLPPTVIFKGKEPKKLFSIQNMDILVLYEESGLITADILKTWINDIWLAHASGPSALIIDSFEPHRTKSLAQMLARENCWLHVIPEGCSSKFQPLDVDVTPAFKEAIKNQWKEFPVGSDVLSSKIKRKYRCPDRDTILYWVQSAYDKINKNPISIRNSFITTGLLQSKTQFQ